MQLYISTITVAEIFYSINGLPNGKLHSFIENSFNKVLRDAFEKRILLFNEAAANFYGKIMSKRKELSRPLGVTDGQTAAILSANNSAGATRYINVFSDCDLDLINPFELSLIEED